MVPKGYIRGTTYARQSREWPDMEHEELRQNWCCKGRREVGWGSYFPHWVLLEKPIVSLLVEEIPRILWNTKVQYNIHKNRPPFPILGQINLVYTPTSHFLKIRLNIIVPYKPGSPKWSLTLRFPHQNPVCASPLPQTCYIPHPPNSYRFDHSNSIGWGVQMTQLPII